MRSSSLYQSNSNVRQKRSQQSLASSSARQNDLIQFIGRLHASLRDASNRKANVKCQSNNRKGDGERNAGTKVPRGLLTGFTLEEAKEIERFRPLNKSLKSLRLGRLINKSLLLTSLVRCSDGIRSSLSQYVRTNKQTRKSVELT